MTGKRLSFMAEITRFDGCRIWTRAFAEPVYEGGICVGVRGAAQDVTDFRAARDQLERAEERLRLAAHLAGLYVFEVDYAQRKVISDGDEALFFEDGISFDRMLRNPFGFVDPRDREEVEAVWDAAMRQGEVFQAEHRVVRGDGAETWALTLARLERGEDGRARRLVGVMKDVTAQRQAEAEILKTRDAAQAANLAKSAFLANVSHEIRTPLNGILGMVEVIGRDPLDAQQRQRLEVIRQSGEALTALLSDVLDLSKIEAGRLELERHPFDVAELLAAACKPFEVAAAQKDLEFAVDLAPQTPAGWIGDAARIRQVLTNLVSNAVKFTSTGHVRARVEPSAAGLRFEIEDTGIGFDETARERMFEKFAQADASINRRFGGAGLGLSICSELVHLMGGKLGAESRLGEGSRFWFEVPLDPAGEEHVPARAPEGPQPWDARALRVLAAEDNPTNQLVLRALLEPFDIDLTVVDNGSEAVEAFETGAFDAVLLDIQMPVMDGIAAARAIRAAELRQGRARTPILALTANVMSHQLAEYGAAGMDDCIAKPIDGGNLIQCLSAALESASDVSDEAARESRASGHQG